MAAYTYEDIREQVFTEEAQRTFLAVRDRVQVMLEAAGAVTLQKAVEGIGDDSYLRFACVDRLVELGELREVSHAGAPFAHRVFMRGCGQ